MSLVDEKVHIISYQSILSCNASDIYSDFGRKPIIFYRVSAHSAATPSASPPSHSVIVLKRLKISSQSSFVARLSVVLVFS